MLDASPVALTIVHGREGRVLEANEAFLRQFGFQRGEVTGRRVAELSIWAEPGDFESLLRRCHERGAVRGSETRLRNSGGNLMRVLVTGELMRGTGSARVLLAFQDVTERESLRDQLRESQKMEAIGQLAAGVAHDFNNLLTVITGNSNMIADEVAGDSEIAELNSELAEAAERAAGLTRQLQTFGRKQFVRPRATDLNELVRESARLLRRLVDANVEVATALGEAPVFASVDTGMMDQLLMNLAVNARDAMPEGGTFRITVREVEFSARGSQRWMEEETRRFVQITASDTGCGMPPEVLERVFEPFFSTKDVGKGTGLGLSTVYGIVKQHQGWIEAESEVGRGARFMVYLPLAGGCAAQTKTENAPPRKGNGEHVLVAEDQPGLRRMIERTLSRNGYQVSITDSGDEARALWLRRPSGYDLLLTDIVMPGGLSGWELARVCRQDAPELRVLFMSGYADLDERGMKGMVVGDNFLCKPFSPEDLLRIVGRQFNGA